MFPSCSYTVLIQQSLNLKSREEYQQSSGQKLLWKTGKLQWKYFLEFCLVVCIFCWPFKSLFFIWALFSTQCDALPGLVLRLHFCHAHYEKSGSYSFFPKVRGPIVAIFKRTQASRRFPFHFQEQSLQSNFFALTFRKWRKEPAILTLTVLRTVFSAFEAGESTLLQKHCVVDTVSVKSLPCTLLQCVTEAPRNKTALTQKIQPVYLRCDTAHRRFICVHGLHDVSAMYEVQSYCLILFFKQRFSFGTELWQSWQRAL